MTQRSCAADQTNTLGELEMAMPSSDDTQPNPAHTYWSLPSRSLTGGCLLIFGIGVLLYEWGRLGHPAVWEPASLLWPIGIGSIGLGMLWLPQKPPIRELTPRPPPLSHPQKPPSTR